MYSIFYDDDNDYLHRHLPHLRLPLLQRPLDVGLDRRDLRESTIGWLAVTVNGEPKIFAPRKTRF